MLKNQHRIQTGNPVIAWLDYMGPLRYKNLKKEKRVCKNYPRSESPFPRKASSFLSDNDISACLLPETQLTMRMLSNYPNKKNKLRYR